MLFDNNFHSLNFKRTILLFEDILCFNSTFRRAVMFFKDSFHSVSKRALTLFEYSSLLNTKRSKQYLRTIFRRTVRLF